MKQDEPLKTECQHFLDCIKSGSIPITGGEAGLEVVQLLEASTESLKQNGAPVDLTPARYGRNTAVPFSHMGTQTVSSARASAAAGNPVRR